MPFIDAPKKAENYAISPDYPIRPSQIDVSMIRHSQGIFFGRINETIKLVLAAQELDSWKIPFGYRPKNSGFDACDDMLGRDELVISDYENRVLICTHKFVCHLFLTAPTAPVPM